MTEPVAHRRRPTIREVARLAGVSHQTVSRYLRSRDGLKSDTLARIDAAVAELDYRPNLLARSMAVRRTDRLAILMPEMVTNPTRILSGAIEAAHEAGFTLEVVSLEGGTEARTERMLELAGSGQVEGVLALAPIDPSVEDRLPQGAAIVVAADFDDEMRSIGELNDASPVTEMMEHLVELGHRRFFHVAGDQRWASGRARKAAYLETVERLGLESVGVFDGDWSAQSGVDAVRSLPAERMPTAVIAGNDFVATGVIRGAAERGLSVPRDLSLTGWDNTGFGQYLLPSLTSVEIDLEGIGRNAMVRLIKTVDDHDLRPSDRPTNRVIWRESTAPPGHRASADPFTKASGPHTMRG